MAQLELGRIDEALHSIYRAIEINPTDAESQLLLSVSKDFSNDFSRINSMELLYGSPDLSDGQKMHLAFALGKAYEDNGQYNKSFDCISKGNKVRRGTFLYSVVEQQALMENLKEVFNQNFIVEHQEAAFSHDKIIFILGMPRSGTTLVEQILSSHPDVFGAGELRFLPQSVEKHVGILLDGGISADTKRLKLVGSAYLAEIQRFMRKENYVTDKLPGNFLYIGLIKTLFPGAKIFHCKRDPMDTCWSIFKNNFSTSEHYYAYDLVELGSFYVSYRELMSYWQELFPGSIYDVNYEDLLADQEAETRAMLAYVGLDWAPSCLDFHKNERLVRTASVAQVRRPIYHTSVGMWRNYETQLAPLRKILKEGK